MINKTIAITGHSGIIGSNFLKNLSKINILNVILI